MLKCMRNVELGLLDPSSIKSAEKTRRAFDMCPAVGVQNNLGPVVVGGFDSSGRLLLGSDHKKILIYDVLQSTRGPEGAKFKIAAECEFEQPIKTLKWVPNTSDLCSTLSRDGVLELCYIEHNFTKIPHSSTVNGGPVKVYHVNASKPTIVAVSSGDAIKILDWRVSEPTLHIDVDFSRSVLLGNNRYNIKRSSCTEIQWATMIPYNLAIGTAFGKILEYDTRSAKTFLKEYAVDPNKQSMSYPVHCLRYDERHRLYAYSEQSKGNETMMNCFRTSDGSLESEFLGSTRRLKLSSKLERVTFDISKETNPTVIFLPTKWFNVKILAGDTLNEHQSVPSKGYAYGATYNDKFETLYTWGREVEVYSSHRAACEAYVESRKSFTVPEPEEMLINFSDL